MNKVILIGNTVKEPDVRFTPNGDAVASFTLATNKHWKDKEGKKCEAVEFHKIVAFDPRASIIRDYVKKGKKVCIVGELKTRKWQDKGGVDHYTTEIICNEIELLAGEAKNSDAKNEHSKGQIIDDDIPDDDIPF